jgi:ATP-dependent Clp protease ATP-binding subunit ClpC
VDGNLGDSARMALANAERISHDHDHHYISTEHIFDEIVIFNPLSPELMLGICRKMLARSPVKVAATDAAVEFRVTKGYDPALGARPLRRTINDLVVQTIVNRLLRGDLSDEAHIVVDVADDALTFQNGERPAEAEGAEKVEVG